MVTILDKKTDFSAAIQRIDSQVPELSDQIRAARSRIAEAHSELDALHTAPTAHAEKLATLSSAISDTELLERSQSEYAAVVATANGQEELASIQAHIAELRSQKDAVEKQHTSCKKDAEKREKALLSQIDNATKAITDLDVRVRALLSTKERLHTEQGSALCEEWSAILKQAEHNAHTCVTESEQAKRVATQVRRDARTRLAEWPELRRELDARHKLSEDATTEGLSLFIDLLEFLVAKGSECERAEAGLPIGYISILQEFQLDAPLLRCVAERDYHLIGVKLERMQELLRRYRHALVMV